MVVPLDCRSTATIAVHHEGVLFLKSIWFPLPPESPRISYNFDVIKIQNNDDSYNNDNLDHYWRGSKASETLSGVYKFELVWYIYLYPVGLATAGV